MQWTSSPRSYKVVFRYNKDHVVCMLICSTFSWGGAVLGSAQSFASVEDLIQNYQAEKLVLYSGGEKVGRTVLTTSPPQGYQHSMWSCMAGVRREAAQCWQLHYLWVTNTACDHVRQVWEERLHSADNISTSGLPTQHCFSVKRTQ
jgi:hypothetical protein